MRVVRFYVSLLPPSPPSPPSSFVAASLTTPVCAARPQPQASAASVPCRTSSANLRGQCSCRSSTDRKNVKRYVRKNVSRYVRKNVKIYARENVRRYVGKNVKKNVSEDMPESMPDRMSEDIPQRMPEIMPEDMSERTSDRQNFRRYAGRN